MMPKIACRSDLDGAAAGSEAKRCRCGEPGCEGTGRVMLAPTCHPGPAIAVYSPTDGCVTLTCPFCGRAFVCIQVAHQVPS